MIAYFLFSLYLHRIALPIRYEFCVIGSFGVWQRRWRIQSDVIFKRWGRVSARTIQERLSSHPRHLWKCLLLTPLYWAIYSRRNPMEMLMIISLLWIYRLRDRAKIYGNWFHHTYSVRNIFIWRRTLLGTQLLKT